MIKNKYFNKDTSVVSRKIGKECILVPIKKRMGDLEDIYTISGVGVYIWELIDGTRSLKDIENVIVKEFDVNGEKAKTDLTKFISQLQGYNCIEEAK